MNRNEFENSVLRTLKLKYELMIKKRNWGMIKLLLILVYSMQFITFRCIVVNMIEVVKHPLKDLYQASYSVHHDLNIHPSFPQQDYQDCFHSKSLDINNSVIQNPSVSIKIVRRLPPYQHPPSSNRLAIFRISIPSIVALSTRHVFPARY